MLFFISFILLVISLVGPLSMARTKSLCVLSQSPSAPKYAQRSRTACLHSSAAIFSVIRPNPDPMADTLLRPDFILEPGLFPSSVCNNAVKQVTGRVIYEPIADYQP